MKQFDNKRFASKPNNIFNKHVPKQIFLIQKYKKINKLKKFEKYNKKKISTKKLFLASKRFKIKKPLKYVRLTRSLQ